MFTITGEKKYSYSIVETKNIFDPENNALLMGGESSRGTRRFVIVDQCIHEIYGKRIKDYFKRRGVNANIKITEAGDKNKSHTNYMSLFSELCRFDVRRRSEPIIAIGGGVVTDLGGFVASTYRRGVPHIKVPTTLMGYVDASVGIKTGVNFDAYKNRMGSFEIPAGIILDRSFLETLDDRNLVNGMGEIIKLAIILDASLFEEIEREGASVILTKFQGKAGESILNKSIQGMVTELVPNLYESDLQRKVDFGHSFSLVIESASGYEIMHGEAVAIDVLFSSYLSVQRGLLAREDFNRIARLYQSIGLPMWSKCIHHEMLWRSIGERVMHRNGKQLIPIPVAIGNCDFVNDLTQEEICNAVNFFQDRYKPIETRLQNQAAV